MFEVNGFQTFELAIQLRDEGTLESDIPLFIQHERTEILVCYGLVVLQCGQQLGNPCRDLLVGVCEKALLLTTDQIGQRKIVLFAVRLRENHLIIWWSDDISLYYGVS